MELITLKSPREQDAMRRAGRITAEARALAGRMVRPGVTTREIDDAVRKFIRSKGAQPSFLNYNGFTGSACISVNEVVIHGIPSKKIVLKEGDIVSIDVGAVIDGFHGDCAATYPCGQISDEAQRLIDVTRQSFWEGFQFAKAGQRVSDISHAVQVYVESHGCSVVRDFVGHGVGTKLHEAPEVPNFGPAGHGVRLQAGMAIAVEPMVCAGDWHVKVLKDGWTTVTVDGSLAAHYENTILITENGPEITTVTEDGAYV
ncbi:MAG: type I methionyl aminopeptidase [Clostridiales bacterium]|nr:type I methionyl aminopeptidase [Clostridiales bacterium]